MSHPRRARSAGPPVEEATPPYGLIRPHTPMPKRRTESSRPNARERADGSAWVERPARLDRALLHLQAEPDPHALLPLTEPMFHILLALSERELHGYGIIISVEEATSGEVRLRTGTLYTAVRRMVDDGLIEESDTASPHSGDDGRRRYYRLTPFGRAVARAEAQRVDALAALARTRGLLRRTRSRS
jgi:DNA-binding PadR family transcriptional regulator